MIQGLFCSPNARLEAPRDRMGKKVPNATMFCLFRGVGGGRPGLRGSGGRAVTVTCAECAGESSVQRHYGISSQSNKTAADKLGLIRTPWKNLNQKDLSARLNAATRDKLISQTFQRRR